jgi:hypothetical protein
MLDAMIRYEEVNTSHPAFDDLLNANLPADILLKIFKSVNII